MTVLFVGVSSQAQAQTQPQELKTGEYSITQSWSQEKDYKRRYLVNVPEGKNKKGWPVFIFLHGNGGNPRGLCRTSEFCARTTPKQT